MTGTITAQNQVGGILGVAWDKEAGKGSVIENCLMLGTMELTRNSSAGMFFGQFVLVWKNAGIATVTNCYGLDTFSATIGEKWTGAKDTAVGLVSGGTIVSNTSVKVALANIKGDTAKATLSALDFDGEDAVWATVADGTPVLKALAYVAEYKSSAPVYVGYQATEADNGEYKTRFIAVVDDYNLYDEIGFDITIGDKTVTFNCWNVYDSITAEYGLVSYSASELGGKYIVALVLTEMSGDVDVTVTPWVKYKGKDTASYGETESFTVTPPQSTIKK